MKSQVAAKHLAVRLSEVMSAGPSSARRYLAWYLTTGSGRDGRRRPCSQIRAEFEAFFPAARRGHQEADFDAAAQASPMASNTGTSAPEDGNQQPGARGCDHVETASRRWLIARIIGQVLNHAALRSISC